MRRILPFVILAVGLAALAVDFVPGLERPFGGGAFIETRLGLDLRGGLRGEYQARPTGGQAVTPDILETVRTIIERRVNATGVAEPLVQTQTPDRITVEIPGVTNEQEVRELIGSTGRLDFVPIPPERDTEVIDGQPMPSGMPVLFSGDQIDVAAPGVDPTSGERVVSFELKPEGARLFDQNAAENFGERFAIVLDGSVQSAPSINARQFGGRGQISGGFTVAEMNNLVTILKFGALPLAIDEVGFNNISATLGQTFLEQSILAGIIGIGLVFAFMIVHYRLPGAVACLALLYYALLVYAIFRLIPVTLTLAGVAAFVLSVGMAVDANILIFERTKEELRAGKTIFTAIEAGFNRAWNSILDSNVSSLITAGILFYFGSSTIRGFALVLVIGVLASMFTAITLSRMMLRWVVRQPRARHAYLYGVNDDEFTIATPRSRSREAGARV
jgi:preprotein translocase subunit SecD